MSLLKLKSKFCKRDTHHRLYNLDRPLIGLTGGIATGKSSASAMLKNKGMPVIDADALVKDVYALESTRKLVSKIAPSAVVKNEIDFKLLRGLFFNKKEIQQKLEAHIYSLLPQAFKTRLAEQTNPNFVIYDVPLLFEKGLQEKIDLTLLIYAPQELQIKRMLERDQMELDLARKILSNQMPIEDKKDLADFVIENTQDFKHLKAELELFCEQVLS